MTYTLPVLELEEIPMRLDGTGRLTWCRMNDEAVLANFAIGLEANADGEWEIVSLHMGTQRLTGEVYRRFAQHFEAEHSSKIHEFVSENYAAAVEGAHLDYDKTRPRTLKHDLKRQIEGVA